MLIRIIACAFNQNAILEESLRKQRVIPKSLHSSFPIHLIILKLSFSHLHSLIIIIQTHATSLPHYIIALIHHLLLFIILFPFSVQIVIHINTTVLEGPSGEIIHLTKTVQFRVLEDSIRNTLVPIIDSALTVENAIGENTLVNEIAIILYTDGARGWW